MEREQRYARLAEDAAFANLKEALQARDAAIAEHRKVPTFARANKERLAGLDTTAKCAEAQRLAAEGLSPKQIARAIGRSVSSVYAYLKRDDCPGG